MPDKRSLPEAERGLILVRRLELLERIGVLVKTPEGKSADFLEKTLKAEFDAAEVDRALTMLVKQVALTVAAGSGIKKTTKMLAYRDYVCRYRRWGGRQRFLSFEKWQVIAREHGKLIRQKGRGTLPRRQEARLSRMTKALLFRTMLWDDLLPDDPPADLKKVSLGMERQ